MLRTTEENADEDQGISVSSRLFNFLILGIALVIIGIVVLAVASAALGSSSTSTGVVILIGPIPIVFGSGPNAIWLILIGIILTVVSIAIFILMNRKWRV